MALELVADQPDDMDDVGGPRSPERHPGGDDDPGAALGDSVAKRHPIGTAAQLPARPPGRADEPAAALAASVAKRHPLGLGDHLLEIGDPARPDAVRPP